MEYLLARTTDKKERAWLINHFLEQFKGTLYRQTMFAEFELRMGELNAQGETLTADLLSKEYKALNEKYYGPDMVSDDEIAMEWARIPPLLLQLLRLPVRHRLLRRHRPVPPHPEGGRERCEGLRSVPLRRLLQGPGGPAEGRRGGHVQPQACPGRSGPVRLPAGRDGKAHGMMILEARLTAGLYLF